MHKLSLVPTDSYSVAFRHDVLVSKVRGGPSRYRRAYQNHTAEINCQFILSAAEYDYLFSFYLTSQALPFEIDLVTDGRLLTHQAHFIPGSFNLNAITGLDNMTVSVSLEVTRPTRDEERDSIIVLLYDIAPPDPNTFLASIAAFSNLILPKNMG